MQRYWLAALALLFVALAASSSNSRVLAAADVVTLVRQTPSASTPLAPAASINISVTLNITLAAAAESVRLIGYEESIGNTIALTADVPVAAGAHSGAGAVLVEGSYTVRPGVRWLAVQAVLGPLAAPLAMLRLPPYIIMDSVSGSRATVYFTPTLSPDLAKAYAAAYDATWQQIGDIFASYSNRTYYIYLAPDADVYEQGIIAIFGASPELAAALKPVTGGINNATLNSMLVRVIASDPGVHTLAHEYAENRFRALHPGNEGAGWFWDGMADLLGVKVGETSSYSRCDIDSLRIRRWASALNGIKENRYLPLTGIETKAQWDANIGSSAKFSLQYAEGYTAVAYWESRFGFPSLVQLVKQPKTVGQLKTAVQQVAGISIEQFEKDYLESVKSSIDVPPKPIPITVHLDAAGTTSQTRILFNTLYSDGPIGRGYRTPAGLTPGDYAFEVTSSGTVRSVDGKVELTTFNANMATSPKGRIFVAVFSPAYKGRDGTGGSEQLSLQAIHGRSGLGSRLYSPASATTSARLSAADDPEDEFDLDRLPLPEVEPDFPLDVALELPAGDCLGPWPDGNRITAVTQSEASVAPAAGSPPATTPPAPAPAPGAPTSEGGPALGGPSHGSTLPALTATLSWTPGAGVTQYQLQLRPANDDGPGLNLIRNAESSFVVEAPELGKGPYILLPGMGYSWRVRTSTSPTSLGENDSGWGPWSEIRTFRTPTRDATRITAVAPVNGGSVSATTQTLRWENGDKDVFYYELQVSPDRSFETDPAKATSFVWTNLVHGGVSAVPNSWTTPPLSPNTTYYWRVRPRVQGDGNAVSWSQSFSFKTGGQ